ncbi:hypothetical protein ACO0LD_10870 [Undibacterium sp. Ji83W]|uniref:hypothetical protein n=1 Tax=Undibacterium sp. Ji83W TaxID=3413043 RepID=UPI003BF1B051
MKKLLLILFLTYVSTAIARADSIEGQVFIVTKGQQAVKLALVTVEVVPEKTVKDTLSALTQSLIEKNRILSENIDGKQREIRDYKSGVKSSDDLATGDVFTEGEKLASVCKLDGQSQKSTESFSTCAKTPEGKSAFTRLAALTATYKAEFAEVRRMRKELNDLIKEHQANAKISAKLADADVFGNMSTTTTKTDADGKFTISVPKNGKYAVLANSKRQIGETSENYQWAVWITTKKSSKVNLMLANDNLIETGCSDCVISKTLPTYIQAPGTSPENVRLNLQ